MRTSGRFCLPDTLSLPCNSGLPLGWSPAWSPAICGLVGFRYTYLLGSCTNQSGLLVRNRCLCCGCATHRQRGRTSGRTPPTTSCYTWPARSAWRHIKMCTRMYVVEIIFHNSSCLFAIRWANAQQASASSYHSSLPLPPPSRIADPLFVPWHRGSPKWFPS